MRVARVTVSRLVAAPPRAVYDRMVALGWEAQATEVAPGHGLVFTSSGGRARFEWSLAPVEAGTLVTAVCEYALPPGILGRLWDMAIVARNVRLALANMLRDLLAAVPASPPTPSEAADRAQRQE